MEYLIAWVAFGIAAGSIAKTKHRNVVLWVFIGLLIGPFAVLILGLMAPGVDSEGETESGTLDRSVLSRASAEDPDGSAMEDNRNSRD